MTRDELLDRTLVALESHSEVVGVWLWLPEQRVIVFADALTEREGELRVWGTPWYQEGALAAMRALLELPFEQVIISHGEPVHSRTEYEKALERAPWWG